MPTFSQLEPDEWTAPNPTIFAAVAAYRYPIALAVLLAALVGYLASSSRPAIYEATTTVYLSESSPFTEEVGDPIRRVQQEALRITSARVFGLAADELGSGVTRRDLAERVSIEPDGTTGVIRVTALAGAPEEAVDKANAVVAAYQQVSRAAITTRMTQMQDALSTQVDELRETIEELRSEGGAWDDVAAQARLQGAQSQLLELQTRIGEMSADAAIYGSGVTDVERAIPPLAPSSPKPLRNAAIAGSMALALASAVAYWRAGSSIRAELDPGVVLGAPLLAQIPQFRATPARAGSDPLFDAEAAEAYQFLLASFEYAIAKAGARSVIVTSPSPGDGKSLTALHLARALAIQGRDVMLVDSDIRARGLTMMLRAGDHAGLVSLADGGELTNVIRRYSITNSTQLSVVPAGQTPPGPTGLLATPSYRGAIARIISSSELTIVDGVPLLTLADASAVATQVDGIVLVLNANIEERELLRVQERLRLTSTPLLGYLVNRVEEERATAHLYDKPQPQTGRLRRFLNGMPLARPRTPRPQGRQAPLTSE